MTAETAAPPSTATENRPEWQRPPFEPGNTAALVSGHRSPRVYGELAPILAAGLTEDRPDLTRRRGRGSEPAEAGNEDCDSLGNRESAGRAEGVESGREGDG